MQDIDAAEEVVVGDDEDCGKAAEGEDGGVEEIEDRLDVVEYGDEEAVDDGEEVVEDCWVLGGDKGGVGQVECGVLGSLGGSRWRRNGCRFVLLLAFRNGANVLVIFCSVFCKVLKKKKIKQENKQVQVR